MLGHSYGHEFRDEKEKSTVVSVISASPHQRSRGSNRSESLSSADRQAVVEYDPEDFDDSRLSLAAHHVGNESFHNQSSAWQIQSPSANWSLSSPTRDVSWLSIGPSKEIITYNNGGSVLSKSRFETFVQKAKPRISACMAGSKNETLGTTAEDVLKLIDDMRLRSMPHQGSRLDKLLFRAETFVQSAQKFVILVESTERGVQEYSLLLMTCIRLLVEHILKGPNSALDTIFGVLDEVSEILDHMDQHSNVDNKSSLLLEILVDSLRITLELAIEAIQVCKSTSKGRSTAYADWSSGFYPYSYLNKLLNLKAAFAIEVWRCVLEHYRMGSQDMSIETLRSWLASTTYKKTRGYQSFQTTRLSHEALSHDWITDLTRRFWKSDNSMLLITGEAGCGKSGMVGSILSRSRAPFSLKARILYFSIEPRSLTQSTPMNLVKGLLLQLLDRSVGDVDFLENLWGAYVQIELNNSPNGESLLWSMLREQAVKQSSEMLIIIDGLDKIEGGVAAALHVRADLQEVVCQRENLRCIVLSRPIFHDNPRGCWNHPIPPSVLAKEIRRFLEQSIRKSTRLTWLTTQEMDLVIKRVSQRSISSLLEAFLFLAYIELRQTFKEIEIALGSVPKSFSDLVDHLILRIDFKEPQITAVIQWLLVAERLITIEELEALLSLNRFQDKLNTDVKQLIKTSFLSLVEIKGSTVQFIHPSIADRLIELGKQSKIPLKSASAHLNAYRCCMEYIKTNFQDYMHEGPTIDVSGRDIDKQMLGRIANDDLLQYCICYYIIHSEKCGSNGLERSDDLKVAHVDSPQLAQCERFYWQTQYSGKRLKQLHLRALQLRKAAFGGQSQSIVQTLITIALLDISLGQTTGALSHLCDAWSMSISLFGNRAMICKDLARKFSEIYWTLTSTGKLCFDNSSDVEQLFEFLWVIEQEEHGSMDKRTIEHIELLIDLYTRRSKYDDVARLLLQLYKALTSISDNINDAAFEYAERFLDVLKRLGRHNEIHTFCEEFLEDTRRCFELWDRRRLTILFRLIDNYNSQGQLVLAKERLGESWKALLDIVSTTHDLDAGLALIDITARLGRLLGKANRHDEAHEIVGKLWAILEINNLLSNDIMIRLRILGESYIELGFHESVAPILRKLQMIYTSRLDETCGEVIRVAIALSKCGAYLIDFGSPESILQEALVLILKMNFLEDNCAELAAELVKLYKANERWQDAIRTCHQLLARIWPELINHTIRGHGLPEELRESAIKLAFMLADLILKQDSVSEAVDINRFIFDSLRQSLSLDDSQLFQAAQRFSICLHEAGLIDEAIAMWKDLRTSCVDQFGPRHDACVRITQALMRFYLDTQSIDSEDFLIDIIDEFGRDAGFCQGPCFDTVLVLVALYEKQGKLAEVRKWYKSLWAAVKDHRHSGSITGDQIFLCFEKYARFLVSNRQKLAAISLARELRAMFKSDLGMTSVLYIRAAIELAKLLEDDESRSDEAVSIYEEICVLHIDGVEDQAIIVVLIQLAKERLASLCLKYSHLAEKAERMLVDAWLASKRTKGCSHKDTFACFVKLMEFYRRKDDKSWHNSAIQRLADYIVDLLVEERNEKRLFEMAGSISNLFLDSQLQKQGLKLMRDLRAELASLDGSSFKGKARFGKERIMQMDRRCFIFIVAQEEILLGKSRPSLFNDVLQSLISETALYEAWSKINRAGCLLQVRIAAGSRLLVFLESQNRHIEVRTLKEEMWEIFKEHTCTDLPRLDALWRLFGVCCGEMGQTRPSISLVEALAEACIELYRKERFSGCLTLVQWISEYFVDQTYMSSAQLARIGLRLASYIQVTAGTGSIGDSSILTKLQKLMSDIIIQVLGRSGLGGPEIGEISIGQINAIVRILGQRKDMAMLERIFQSLWDMRISHKWRSSTTIAIGRRLCEVKFAMDCYSAAMTLIEDICYNLRDVYGALHELTIECENLRARFFNTRGQHDCALRIHADIIQKASENNFSKSSNISTLLLDQSRLLRAAFEMNEGWDDHSRDLLPPLLEQIFDDFQGSDSRWHEEVGRATYWQPSSVLKRTGVQGEDLEANQDNEASTKAAEFGCWRVPQEWSIVEDFEEEFLDT